MKKIIASDKEGVAEIIEKILAADDSEIVLVLPRDSELKESVSNFNLIKREAVSAKKNVLIESVDDKILSLAKAARLESLHSLFQPKHLVSDIVQKEENYPLAEEKAEETAEKKKRLPIKFPKLKIPKIKFSRRRAVFILILIFVFGGIAYAAVDYLPQVEVDLTLKKVAWNYNGAFQANKNVNQIDSGSNILPAELFSKTKNTTQLFVATGQEMMRTKAKGIISVYNAYSSSPQPLVATTRFSSPDGKIFRLNYSIVIPGAKIENGKITPSSIDAAVTADEAGSDYNIASATRLSVPGLKGTPKYSGFYGIFSKLTEEGFIGEKNVPTQSDIDSAKKSISQMILANLDLKLFSSELPSDFQILDGASTTTVDKIIVGSDTDNAGKFNVFAQGTFQALGFRESDLKNLLSQSWQKDYPDAVQKDASLKYDNLRVDFGKGILFFNLNASLALAGNISVGDFINKIVGKDESGLRNVILAFPSYFVEKATVSFWPFWVKTVPQDKNRIKINID